MASCATLVASSCPLVVVDSPGCRRSPGKNRIHRTTVTRRRAACRAACRAAAGASSDESPKAAPASVAGPSGQGFAQGYVPGGGGMSAEQILEVPIDRRKFKPTSEQCPFCVDAPVKESGSKCLGICRNPQNVPGPLFYPHQMQDVEDAVRLQINAMRDIDEPRRGHGVQVMWEFSVEHANMERSRYFGFSTDMYHYDHFIGKALVNFDPLVRNKGHEIVDVSVMEDGRTMVKVKVTDIVEKESHWIFIMVRRTFGKYDGCWQSHRVVQTNDAWWTKHLEFI